MAEEDRRRWDAKHAAAIASDDPCVRAGASAAFVESVAAFLPARGRALDVACGRGAGTVALALRGLEVVAVDVSLVALAEVRRRADEAGVGRRVHTVVGDLDDGLPPDLGRFDVVLCSHFHAPALWPALRAALAPGGVLLLESLTTTNVDLGLPAPSARWLVGPGEIVGAADGLEILRHEEAVIDGAHRARLAARAP